MKKTLFLLTLFYSILGFSQSDFVGSGGNATGAGGTASYSIGQMAYEYASGSNGNVSQGVQQAFEVFLSIPDVNPSITASLYPNPATSTVTLAIDFSQIDPKTTYEITDVNGRILRGGKVSSNKTTIEVGELPKAIYFFNVISAQNRIKSFKLLKK